MPATSRACCRPRSPVQITVTALCSRGQAASSGPAVTPDRVTRPVGVTQVVFTRSVQGRRLLIAQRPANRNRHETPTEGPCLVECGGGRGVGACSKALRIFYV